ncbi:MAG: radical SAM protein [Bacteroides sp.]|nr:radical SAM protein [Bacteroides sp.]
MKRIVSSYIKNPAPVFTMWKNHKIYFPKNILIDATTVTPFYIFRELMPESFLCQKLDLVSKRFYSGPLLLTMMLTNRCLTHCKYCYADTSTKVETNLSTSRILELIQEAAELQVQQVNLIGGEVFLHKDWDLILKELIKYNIAPEYISTKLPLTNELLIKLQETGYQGLLQVSLDVYNKEILKELLGVKKSYASEILKGILLLDQSAINYQISSVLTTYNCNRRVLTELFNFLSDLEYLQDWRIIPVNNSITIDYKEFSKLKPAKSEIESVFEYMEEFILPVSKFPIILGREAIDRKFYSDHGGSSHFRGASCSALNTHMFILPDGQVTICEQLYWNPRFIIGDVKVTSLKDVWNSSKSLALRNLSQQDVQKESACHSCSLFEECFRSQNRCWSNIIKSYGDSCWDFPDPRCCFAPKMKNDLGY